MTPSWFTSESQPPYYRGHPVFGAALRFRDNPVELLSSARAECGPAVKVRLGYLRTYLFFRPEHVKHILLDNQRNYEKAGYSKLEPLIGNALLSSEGDTWRSQRSVVQPAFHRRHVDSMAATMVNATEQLADRWYERLSGGPTVVDVETEMTRLTLTVVSRTLFGYDVGHAASEVGEALRFVLRYGTDRIGRFFYLPEAVPTPANRRYRRSIRRLDEIVDDLIANRRMESSPRDDLLSMLLGDLDDRKQGVSSQRELRDQIMTFLSAGHETTAMALTWALYLLDQNQDKADILREELDDALNGRPPTPADLRSLPYTEMFLNESLRMYPPVWGLARKALQEDRVGAYHVPKHSRVIVSPYVTHRDPDLWKNPDTFEPERFSAAATGARSPYAFFPFGLGPRTCVGRNFARTEAMITLAILAQRFSFELARDQRVSLEPIFTLKPSNGLKMKISRRG